MSSNYNQPRITIPPPWEAEMRELQWKRNNNYPEFTDEDQLRLDKLIHIYKQEKEIQALDNQHLFTSAQNLGKQNIQLLPKRADKTNLSIKEYLATCQDLLINSDINSANWSKELWNSLDDVSVRWLDSLDLSEHSPFDKICNALMIGFHFEESPRDTLLLSYSKPPDPDSLLYDPPRLFKELPKEEVYIMFTYMMLPPKVRSFLKGKFDFHLGTYTELTAVLKKYRAEIINLRNEPSSWDSSEIVPKMRELTLHSNAQKPTHNEVKSKSKRIAFNQISCDKPLSSMPMHILHVKDNKVITVGLDTGAEDNFLTKSAASKLNLKLIPTEPTKLTAANKEIDEINETTESITVWLFPNKKTSITFSIISELPHSLDAILCAKTIQDLGGKELCFSAIPENCNVNKEISLYSRSLSDALRGNSLLKSTDSFNLASNMVKIKTNCSPIYKKQKPEIAFANHSKVSEIISNWLKEGKIEETSFEGWCLPLITAEKKAADGSIGLRLCLNPKALNPYIEFDEFPIPKITDLIPKLAGASYFSKLDLKESFLQLPIWKEDRKKTTFQWNNKFYRFVGAPFGLCHLTFEMQRILSTYLADMKEFCFNYVDDVIVYSKSKSEHEEQLTKVVNKLTEAKMIVNLQKCSLFQRKLCALGYIFDKDGYSIDEENLRKGFEFPIPQTGTQMNSFLGTTNFARFHIPKYADIAAPLDELRLRKKILKEDWTEERQNAFLYLKNALLNAIKLSYPLTDDAFAVATDASKIAISAVLLQLREGKYVIVNLRSRKLSKTEQKYSAYKRELLAIKYALEKFRTFIYGRHFKLYCDNQAISALNDEIPLTAVEDNWAHQILKYNFEVIYIKGVDNVLADCLSRIYSEKDDEEWQIAGKKKNILKEKKISALQKSSSGNKSSTNTTALINSNNPFAPLSSAEETNPSNANNPGDLSDFPIPDATRNQNIDSSGNLADLRSPVSPNSRIIENTIIPNEVIQTSTLSFEEKKNHMGKIHALGHFGGVQMSEMLRRAGISWPNQKEECINFVKSCTHCQCFNSNRKGFHPYQSINSLEPFSHIAIDLAGPFSKSSNGNQYVLVIFDYHSKFRLLYPLATREAASVAIPLLQCFCTFGFPKILQSDNGTEFVNEVVKEIIKKSGIDRRLISPYYPQSNGGVENSIKVMKNILGKICDGNEMNWELYLPATQYFMNQSIHSSHGSTPFAAMFARSANNFENFSSLDLGKLQTRNNVKNFIDNVENFIRPLINDLNANYQTKIKKQKNSRGKIKTKSLEPGQIVYVEVTPDLRTALSPSFEGPYIIVRQNKAGNYILRTEKGYQIPKKSYPLSKLKVIDLPLQSLSSLPETHNTIKKIIGHEGNSSETKYWVQWKGKGEEDKSLLPSEDIVNYRLIQSYWKRYYSASNSMRGDDGDSNAIFNHNNNPRRGLANQ
jgi:hypothetical protein